MKVTLFAACILTIALPAGAELFVATHSVVQPFALPKVYWSEKGPAPTVPVRCVELNSLERELAAISSAALRMTEELSSAIRDNDRVKAGELVGTIEKLRRVEKAKSAKYQVVSALPLELVQELNSLDTRTAFALRWLVSMESPASKQFQDSLRVASIKSALPSEVVRRDGASDLKPLHPVVNETPALAAWAASQETESGKVNPISFRILLPERDSDLYFDSYHRNNLLSVKLHTSQGAFCRAHAGRIAAMVAVAFKSSRLDREVTVVQTIGSEARNDLNLAGTFEVIDRSIEDFLLSAFGDTRNYRVSDDAIARYDALGVLQDGIKYLDLNRAEVSLSEFSLRNGITSLHDALSTKGLRLDELRLREALSRSDRYMVVEHSVPSMKGGFLGTEPEYKKKQIVELKIPVGKSLVGVGLELVGPFAGKQDVKVFYLRLDDFQHYRSPLQYWATPKDYWGSLKPAQDFLR